MKVGCVSYINALPFHLPFQLGQLRTSAQFTYAIPSVLNTQLQEGKLDVALTSSVEYLDRDYHLLPQLGIVGLRQVLSVNLYTRIPIEKLHGVPIGLTDHSATSISLLKVLCRYLWKVSPSWEQKPPCSRLDLEFHRLYDAFLLIGDAALIQENIAGYQTIDLAAAWHEMTGLPFVFAVFSAQNTLLLQPLDHLQQELEKALSWSEQHPEEIERAALQQCRLPLKKIRAYYANLRYRLGSKEIESLELFRRLRHGIPTICP